MFRFSRTRQDTAGKLFEVVSHGEGVYLHQFPATTTLLIETANSLYRVVITHAPEACIQGGALFPEPTAACLIGSSSVPGARLKADWIGIGLRIQLCSGDRLIMTSRVRAITADRRPAQGDDDRNTRAGSESQH